LPGAAPVLQGLNTLRSVSTNTVAMLAVAGDVVAAAFDADDRPTILLNGPQGLTLVTCATAYCIAD
jgi:hypothetical protein